MRECVIVACAVAIAGCGGVELDDGVETTASPGITRNGITRNGITRNGITRNGITRNGSNGSGGQDVTSARLEGASFSSQSEADTLEFLTYVVSCALTHQETVNISVNGVSHSFSGELGLAWHWKNTPCNESCQRWVSACLMSRTNAFDVEVSISLRGSRLTTTQPEVAQYPLHEGAFYGNLFGDQPQMFACAGSMFDNVRLGDELSRLQNRVCANTAANEECPIEITGPCREFLAPPWHLSNERSCNWQSQYDGMLNDCGDALGMPHYPYGTQRYQEIISTFLSPASAPWMQ